MFRQQLKQAKEEAERVAREAEEKGEERTTTTTTERPCVGMCFWYKSRGLENPYEELMKKHY